MPPPMITTSKRCSGDILVTHHSRAAPSNTRLSNTRLLTPRHGTTSVRSRLSLMNPYATASRHLLRAIARRAMLERGLLADFSPAVLAETAAITTATTSAGGTIRDLRSLLWASIDNDDSRDLDQLSVAQSFA